MAVSLPAPGQDPWGAKLNAAINSLDARIVVLEGGSPPPAGTLVLSRTALTVLEGGTATFTVKLSVQPAANVVVNVVSADVLKATVSPASLTFTSANYSTAKTVTVTGTPDADIDDINALITCSATGYTSVTVDVHVTDTTVPATFTPVILMIGESNSGGYAQNVQLAASELLPRPAVQIWDNINMDGFETLHIGVNNLLGHAGLEAYSDSRHGWEAQLALSAEAVEWQGAMHLVKAGQGASRVDQWDNDDPYWITFTQRIDAALAAVEATGKDPQIYVWATLGGNDHIAGTPGATVEAGVKSWIQRIREHVGRQLPVFYCEMTNAWSSYDPNFSAIDLGDSMLWLIQTKDCPLEVDGNHWTAAGMKTIAGRMISASLSKIGQGASYESKIGPVTPTPSPDAPTDPVVWTQEQSGTVGVDGSFTKTGVNPCGALSGSFASGAFVFETTYLNAAVTLGMVVVLTSSGLPDYAWSDQTLANGMLGGVYQNGGKWYYCIDYTTAVVDLGTVTSFPAKTLTRAKGTDVEVSVSYDDGVTWTVLHTDTGRLVGKTTVYLKVMAALETANGKLTTLLATGGAPPTLPSEELPLDPVVWTDIQNCTYDTPSATLIYNGTVPGGALGGSVDPHNFILQMTWTAPLSQHDASIMMLDDDATPNFVWDTSQVYVAGGHQFSGTLYATKAYSDVVTLGAAAVGKYRLRSDGADDIVLESQLPTLLWKLEYRFVNAALGKSVLYIKTVFAAGGNKIKLEKGTLI